MRKFIFSLALLTVASTIHMAMADSNKGRGNHEVRGRLSGFNEVHFIAGNPAAVPPVLPALRGAVSTAASGKFEATIDEQNSIIHYELSYKNLEGTVLQAHIHLGQKHTVGGIVVWLCQTTATPAPDAVKALTPFCPQEGTVSGTITPPQVLAPAGQGIEAGAFNELLAAIRAKATYANVHTSLFPPGEIRDQLSTRGDD